MNNTLFNTKYSSLLLGIMAFCSSCDGFLDNVPITSQLESNYFENEVRVEKGIGSIYSEVGVLYAPNFGGGGAFNGTPLFALWQLPGDDLTVDNNNNSDFEGFFPLSVDNKKIQNYWSILYAIINRANFMLDQLSRPELLSKITEDYANCCKGEALFLRSWSNMLLWDGFRKAPNQSSRITDIESSVLPPSKSFELLDQAINDLILSEQLLPESWNMKNKGRVFKNSARGLLVKCYILRACYSSLYGGDRLNDYKNAINAFESISEESSIEGVHFGENFDYRTENNKESLFEYQASENPQQEDNPWLNGNQGGQSGALGTVYIQFWESYYTFGSFFGPTNKLIKAFESGDPRMDETVSNTSQTNKYDWMKGGWKYFDGYQFIKYINGERRGRLDKKYGKTSPNNPRILRLGDVKLAIAEAYLQTGDEASARRQLNDIRKRARLSTSDGSISTVPADYNRPITMEDIMNERLIELAGEGMRYSDMKRWHVAGYINLGEWAANPKLMWGYDTENKADFQFDVTKHLLWPIPYSEMARNPLLLSDGNNPGYN